jgi:hypothetical protein
MMDHVTVDIMTGERTVIPVTDAEMSEWAAIEQASAMPQLRQQRDQLLRESDTAVLPDRWEIMSAETQLAWATYRQALRDLPANTSDPLNPIWPTRPGA